MHIKGYSFTLSFSKCYLHLFIILQWFEYVTPPTKLMSKWNLKSHLRVGSLQIQSVKKGSSWVGLGPKSYEWCPYKKRDADE